MTETRLHLRELPRLVLFDLAGTIVDHGSRAPLLAFRQAFARRGVQISVAAASAPMGLSKRAHLEAMLAMFEVREAWRHVHGDVPTPEDADALYADFSAALIEAIADRGALIAGAATLSWRLHDAGVKVGTTTGYFAEAAEHVWRQLDDQGFLSDVSVCATDVRSSRPAPDMIELAMHRCGVYDPTRVVSVGDTTFDVMSARNAKVWSVGVTRTGSLIGCTREEWTALAPETRRTRLESARAALGDAGAHAVIESVATLPSLLPDLDAPSPRASPRAR